MMMTESQTLISLSIFDKFNRFVIQLSQVTETPPNYVRKWRCSLCSKQFPNPASLETHLLTEHMSQVVKKVNFYSL